MKVLIKANNENGKTVIENLKKIEAIFNKPALRFSLKCTLPKKYRRAVLSFKLNSTPEGMIYSQDGLIDKKDKYKLFSAVDDLIKSCDGSFGDCTKELI